ncbi:serine protease (putative secreted protein) [Minicystis rosea]|nr:serine protease (putative secreted protein) [Minicystis rosea]
MIDFPRRVPVRRAFIPLSGAVLAAAALIGCGEPRADEPETGVASLAASTASFSMAVDDALDPRAAIASSDGARPIAAYADDAGVVTELVTGEVIVRAATDTERAALDAFVHRWGGSIVADDAAPPPPARLRRDVRASELAPTRFLVRLDPSAAPIDTYAAEAAHRGLRGAYRASSAAAVRLLALISHEREANGLVLSPNFVARPGSMLHGTHESVQGGAVVNLFDHATFRGKTMGPLGNGSTISRAWQFVAGHGAPANKLGIAVLDAGFWLDPQGHPFDDPAGTRSDLPASPTQWDFVDNDAFAGGPNTLDCNGKNQCSWHGNAVAGVAAGAIDDLRGFGGSGGTVAEPWLFRIDYTQLKETAAIKTARLWGADVVNMSFGLDCNADCMDYDKDIGLLDEVAKAKAAGLVLVAIAGNYAKDVTAANLTPCVLDGVICVGALADDSSSARSSSDFGAGVDVWAPGEAWVAANDDTFPNGSLVSGTSIAAPIVAGVAAMMRAMNPSLDSDATRAMLHANERPVSSPDPKVTSIIDALAAVEAAAGHQIPADALEPNNAPGTASTLVAGAGNPERTIDHPGDIDFYRFSLADYSSFKLTVDNMVDLGPLYVTIVPETAPGVPSNVTLSKTPTGQIYVAALAAPGTYLVKITSPRPQPYALFLSVDAKGLSPDAFEINDTFGTASKQPEGGFEVNLHKVGDVDHYAFNVSPPPLQPFWAYGFSIDSADYPLTVDVYVSGQLLISYGPTKKVDINLPSGSVVVRVGGEQRGRYTFHAGAYETGSFEVYKKEPIPWYVDPGGPYEGVLIGIDETVALPARSGGVLVIEGQVHVELLDLDGKLLARDVLTRQGKAISLAALEGRAGALHILRDEGATTPSEGGPAFPGSVSWSVTPLEAAR